MSGIVTAGVLLCGVHIANAQTNIDTGYTITIPSEVGIDKDSGKGSFSVSGKMDAQTELDVTTTSQNDYKLKCGSQFIDYTLDKQSFHIDNIKSANPKNFNEDFNITLANTNTNYSGPYKDRLAFNIQCHKYTYELDMNSILDGKVEFGRHNYGTVDVYINGERVADDVSDFNGNYPYGTEFEFKDLKGTDGHHYAGVGSIDNVPPIPLKGRIGIDAYCVPRANAPHILCTPCYFKFDTNKLALNYHADGAQSWNDFGDIVQNVSNKDVVYSETKKYGDTFDSQDGLVNVNRLIKKGYTAVANTWTIKEAGNKKVMDNVGLAKMEDVADYCGVLEDFKKNDVTVDLYPIWEPLLNTITYDANGGSLSTAKTQQIYTGQRYKVLEKQKSFSGTSLEEYEDLGYYNYSFGNKITLATKIQFSSTTNEMPKKLQEFFCNYESGGFGLGIDSNAKLFFSVFRKDSSNYDILHSSVSIKPNQVYWIVGVYDGDSHMLQIYVNGKNTGALTVPASENSEIKPSPCGVSIGANPGLDGYYDNLTAGNIWKCALWKSALSAQEILKMYETNEIAENSFIFRDYASPEKDYCLFDGWYTQAIGGNKITSSDVVKGATTLYAHYKPISSFIEYNSNGGSGNMSSEVVLSDNKKQLLKNTFVKERYFFKGWYATRRYKGVKQYLYQKGSTDNAGWFELGKQQAGYDNLYLIPDEDTINKMSAYDGLTITFQAQWEKELETGQLLKLEDSEYIIMGRKNPGQYLVISKLNIGSLTFQASYDPNTYLREDGQNANTYENSTIDEYLEKTWYKNLSSTFKKAIVSSSIKQNAYSNQKDSDSKHETGYGGQTYNSINRHVYLPSIDEISKLVDLKSPDKVNNFLNSSYMWTRDSYQGSQEGVEFFNYYFGYLLSVPARDTYGVRPAFVIDLSKVNYTVTGTVNYK